VVVVVCVWPPGPALSAALLHLVAPARPLAGPLPRAAGPGRDRPVGGAVALVHPGAPAPRTDRSPDRCRLLVLRRRARRAGRGRHRRPALGIHLRPEIMIDLTRKRDRKSVV